MQSKGNALILHKSKQGYCNIHSRLSKSTRSEIIKNTILPKKLATWAPNTYMVKNVADAFRKETDVRSFSPYTEIQ